MCAKTPFLIVLDEQLSILDAVLRKQYQKSLDAEQTSLLLAKTGAASPLWLQLCCEELRIFGVFEKVTIQIRSLPETVQGLLSYVLRRLEREHGLQRVESPLLSKR